MRFTETQLTHAGATSWNIRVKVACLAQRVRRSLNSARLVGIRDDADTRKAAAALADYWKCDWAIVAPALRLADFRLLALDMDSTLVDIETLDEVAALAGKGAEVAAITEAAMRGEIADYEDSLRRRVAMLAGADAGLLERVYGERLRLNPGAEALRDACAAVGCATDRVIAIGDGANDLEMLALAGISVAYRAKPVVRQRATYALDYTALDGVLNWFS